MLGSRPGSHSDAAESWGGGGRTLCEATQRQVLDPELLTYVTWLPTSPMSTQLYREQIISRQESKLHMCLNIT